MNIVVCPYKHALLTGTPLQRNCYHSNTYHKLIILLHTITIQYNLYVQPSLENCLQPQ